MTTATAWLGALAYTLQLYFDFSGYSDMAIGLGLMLGFKLPENFDRPYSAVSITDLMVARTCSVWAAASPTCTTLASASSARVPAT